jgi:hypothetical protein
MLPGMSGIADSMLTRFSPRLPYVRDSLANPIRLSPYKPGPFRFRAMMSPQIIGIPMPVRRVIIVVIAGGTVIPQIIGIYAIPGINGIQTGIRIIQTIVGI